jgi:hypothetical protein
MKASIAHSLNSKKYMTKAKHASLLPGEAECSKVGRQGQIEMRLIGGIEEIDLEIGPDLNILQ